MKNAIRSYDFAQDAPAGFYVALRVGFAYPLAELNTFPQEWVSLYTEKGLMLHDPVMHWVYVGAGAARWSDIGLPDPMGVLDQAAQAGLRYGVAICCCEGDGSGIRSFGSFARADREYSLAETAALAAKLQELHDYIVPPANLTRAELEALRFVKDGVLLRDIAKQLGVSEGAIKQRLRGAKTKLKARNSTHAATLALEFGLI